MLECAPHKEIPVRWFVRSSPLFLRALVLVVFFLSLVFNRRLLGAEHHQPAAAAAAESFFYLSVSCSVSVFVTDPRSWGYCGELG